MNRRLKNMLFFSRQNMELIKTLVFSIACVSQISADIIRADSYGAYNDHCNGIDCPKYNVVMKNADYELRHYRSYQWVSAIEVGLDYKKASEKNFMKLFRYISGANLRRQKVPMTAPVLNHITVTQGPFCAANFTMNFFVPYKFQNDVPKPSNLQDKVFISTMKDMHVYVTSFGGFVSIEDIQTNGAKLAKALQKDGLAFDETQLISAGYDSPFKLHNRHNEVMVFKK